MSYSTRKGGSLSDGEMGRPASDVYFCKSVSCSKLNPLIRESQLPSREGDTLYLVALNK
jgi:hypothetical protein